MALKLGIQTYQILTNDDEVCIPNISSTILLAVKDSLSRFLYFILYRFPRLYTNFISPTYTLITIREALVMCKQDHYGQQQKSLPFFLDSD